VDEERILSMSAFEAAYLIRSFRRKHPSLTEQELIQTARSIRTDFYSYDYRTGLALERLIQNPKADGSLEGFFTAAVEAVMTQYTPFWIRLAPSGRRHVLQAMSVNGAQCLRAAGLMDESLRAIAWWDGLSRSSRSEKDDRLLAQGREGERLSLAYEVSRLDREGLSKKPLWVALEDNTVGYDILSYSTSGEKEQSRLIEVKTSVGSNPRLFLSKNEWRAAEQFGAAFEFHHWMIDTKTLSILSVEDVRPHIPSENGHGKWEVVEIRLKV
jgi:hypothetical protein